MQVEWYGQSAFRLSTDRQTVAIDPFGDMSPLTRQRGMQWDYPHIADLTADLLLVTHEHLDHNATEVVGGEPVILRSTAGKLESPIGEVLAVASEHDAAAGTERGPNTIFAFTFGGHRIAHFGDFGQSALRPEQAAALGSVDLLFIPVGAGPTIGPDLAYEIATTLNATWVVPMHYRTPKIGFLEPADDFLAKFDSVNRLDSPGFDLDGLPGGAVVPAAP
jgi:L-ascorbate metabolism protein UlaG (beta-lactamase superfamily)